MAIKRCPIIFHNVLGVTISTDISEWEFAVKDLRNKILVQGFYPTGPVIFTVHDIEEENNTVKMSIYIPINEAVQLENTEKYHFHEDFVFEDALVIRHADLEEDVEQSIATLQLCAEDLNLELDSNVYNINLDVYGDIIIDVFIPILGEKNI